MDDVLKKDVPYQLGFYLLQFEILCHFYLIESLIEIFKMDSLQPKYGCEAGLNAFIAMGYQLDYEIINKDDMWSCFFIKMLAIKYDESFDNFQSLLKFSSIEDVKTLHQYCENEKLSFENLSARKFAQKLRNTLHYQEILLDTNKMKGTSTKNIVTAIYLSNTGTDSMTEFRNAGLEMINEMRLLQRIIRKIISVDKNYSE